MFVHSLKGGAKDWYRTAITVSEVKTWDQLILEFYHKFIPLEKARSLRMQIAKFRQGSNEHFCDTWERFRGLELECPHHGFNDKFIAKVFYNSLSEDSKKMLDSAAGGSFGSIEDFDARKVIQQLAFHSQYLKEMEFSSSSLFEEPSLKSPLKRKQWNGTWMRRMV